ncbi:MAG: protein kinase [bacterium]
MSKPQSWQEIDRIFAAALEREPAERPAFLDEACGGDEQLRKEVESLIAHDVPESLVGSSAVEEATRLLRIGLLAGERIGPYQIIRSLGAGGMGHVYLAQDERLNRPVAVKLLSDYHAAAEERIRRFRQEALATSALNHPNILTVYEIGSFEGKNFIATEFVAGLTLRTCMQAGALPVASALENAMQIASALSAAHQAGITHRDIKPDNVMVRADGLIKVLDFGIAKYAQPDVAGTAQERMLKTAPGTVVGTAAYMSPEQARGLTTDARTDIWSLGVILYEMVTARRPFKGDTTMDVMAAVLKREPPRFSVDGSVVPESLERIVFKALEKERQDRYQTAAELLADLKELKKKLESGAEQREPDLQPQSAALETVGPRSPTANSALPQRLSVDESTTTSSAEYIVGRLKQHKLAVLVFAAFIIAAVAGAYFYFGRAHLNAIESIAVMPFVNESGNSEVEYLSDGMTDTLINSLSQLPHLSVKARSSVFRYKGKEVDPQKVAAELSVQALLIGRVVQRGDDLTLYLSLVDAHNGNQIWGTQYDRKLSQLVSLQSEIAHDVSEKLHLRLTSTEQQRLTKRGTENTEAYQAYLKGRYYWDRGLAPGSEKSRDYYQQAIDLDPSYALAYSGLASHYSYFTANGLLPPDETWPKAEAAANKALALDPTLAEPYAPLAAVKLNYYRDWPAAERYFRRAIELNPKFAEAYGHYAISLIRLGRNEEALAIGQRAVELEPLSLRVNQGWARILFYARQYDRAIDLFRKTLELDPNFPPAHEWLGYVYEQKGMQREAVTEWSRALSLSGASEQASSLERTYATSSFEAAVRALGQQRLDKLNERMKRNAYVPAFEYVAAYTRLGDKEQALVWLDKAVQERNHFALDVKVNPLYDKLRDDPRFQDIVRRVGL